MAWNPTGVDREIIVREIPLPGYLLKYIVAVHGDRGALRIWPLGRTRAWQLIKEMMVAAGIADGPHACPKGLRHGFGVHAIRSVPLTLIQRWLGHASLETTSIYLQVTGQEERNIAASMWEPPPANPTIPQDCPPSG